MKFYKVLRTPSFKEHYRAVAFESLVVLDKKFLKFSKCRGEFLFRRFSYFELVLDSVMGSIL